MNEPYDLLRAKQSISIDAAKQLSITTNTPPQLPFLTPRWLLRFLPWEDVDTGIYRINQVEYLKGISAIPIPPDGITIKELKSIPILENISDNLLETIIKKLEEKPTSADEVIIKQGEEKKDFYIILEGLFEISLVGNYAKKMVIKTLGVGDYFGEISAVEGVPRQATVTSLREGKLLYVDKKTFDKIFKDTKTRKKLEDAIKERKKELDHINQFGEIQAPLIAGHLGEPPLPRGYVNYKENPREIHLSTIQTIIDVLTRITDIYNVPYDQLEQQLHVTIENIREREEWELINNSEFGLLNNVAHNMVMYPRKGAPTPDDLDDLLSLVWKSPSFFLAHPKTIAAFGRECTFRGVPPPTVEIFGSQFLTWRGIPLVPSNKIRLKTNGGVQTTDIILMRAGKNNQGVLGLHKAKLGTHNVPSLTIQYMGTNERSIASYLLTKYLSLAVLVPDALGVLRNVELGAYHQYD